MAIRKRLRSLMQPPSFHHHEQCVVDLGGQTSHEFQFHAQAPLVYTYFTDIPSIFKLLPDVIEAYAYDTNMYRLIVGASDNHGHTMAGIFDMQLEETIHHTLRLFPVEGGPAPTIKGITFPGNLWLEAHFNPQQTTTNVTFSLEISMSIPIPGALNKMPRTMLQKMGEKAMSVKMSHMIRGFVRHIEADFARFAHWKATTDPVYRPA